jgi:hypothetical protein
MSLQKRRQWHSNPITGQPNDNKLPLSMMNDFAVSSGFAKKLLPHSSFD